MHIVRVRCFSERMRARLYYVIYIIYILSAKMYVFVIFETESLKQSGSQFFKLTPIYLAFQSAIVETQRYNPHRFNLSRDNY